MDLPKKAVILHGWNLDKTGYVLLCRALRKNGIKVFIFDLPGFGQKKFLRKALTLTDYYKYVHARIRYEKIRDYILIGHSFGGRIGVKIASGNENKPKVLVLTGTPAVRNETRVKVRFFRFLAKSGSRLTGSFLSIKILERLKKILYRFAGSYDYMKTSGFLRETFLNIINENIEPDLVKIKIPTVILWGRQDKIVPFKTAQKINSLIQGSLLIDVKGFGHNLPQVKGDVFFEELNKGLKDFRLRKI